MMMVMMKRSRFVFDTGWTITVNVATHDPTGHTLFHGHATVSATKALLLWTTAVEQFTF